VPPIVVDTNVAVVANGNDEFPSCSMACANRIRELTRDGTLVIDDRWLIIGEYRKNLRSSGQPGVGDAFLKWVLTNQANLRRCRRVPLTPQNDSFAEFPADPRLAGFDPRDRKFVAVALASPDHPAILQALDSSWWGFRQPLAECGVVVEFLCPNDIARLHHRRSGASSANS